jgi:hypothetical protein
MLGVSPLCSWLLSQNINPITQSSMRMGRNISAKVSFKTRPIPAVIDAIRKNIPMINIIGIRRMPNISLCITSDTGYLGISITTKCQNNKVKLITARWFSSSVSSILQALGMYLQIVSSSCKVISIIYKSYLPYMLKYIFQIHSQHLPQNLNT